MTIVAIREYRPDLVICHRACDYHPDHRAVGMLVQDAIFGCTVPNVMALTPALDRSPVLGYTYDSFTDPTPYVPTVAVDRRCVRAQGGDGAHESQMYEWNFRFRERIEGEEARRAYLREGLMTLWQCGRRGAQCLVKW